MAWDLYLHSLVYLVEALVLFVLGKYVFQWLHRRISLEKELIQRDNLAMAIAMGGYLVGLTMALGGALWGTSASLAKGVVSMAGYGVLAIVLLNAAGYLNDWLILTRSDADKEIVEDQNSGVGMVTAASHVATGLILNGVLSGEGGGLVALLIFWLLGQLALIVAAKVYDRIMPYDVQLAMEGDNVAVGTAYAGVLLAIGNIVRFAVMGDFTSWAKSLSGFGISVLLGLVLLPVVRLAADKIILSGGSLTQELVKQDRPNIGAGVTEAICYVSMSFLVGWSLH
ncbi:MAG: DUF350 domain-containing protein [Syntrophobacteraceae bacterium]